MEANFSQVERVLAMMREDERLGWVVEDQFGSLCEQARLAAFLREKEDTTNAARLRQSHGRLRPLFDDRMLLFGVLLRTALDFERRVDGKLDEGLWFQFSRQDIEFFFLVLRAAMDHAACFIVSAAETKHWIELDSFETLRNRCQDEQNATKALGADWTRIVRGVDWFDDFRTWRLHLAHEGAMAMTFFDAETIPFQIHQNGEHKVNVPEIMYNDTVVDFTRFAALYMSYFLCFLEEMALTGKRYLDITQARMPMMHSGGGVEALHHWAVRLLVMREPATPQGKQGAS